MAPLHDRPAQGTRLDKAIAPLAAANPGMAGIRALFDPVDAFAARVVLAQEAERGLDIQSYIWRADRSGKLLFQALIDAAARGVRVRLLLDDNNTAGLDPLLAALDAHPGIEVRLFNPFRFRRHRWLGYLTDFPRLNRRMHNKSFTADGQATIVGGRNVGDEYFEAGGSTVFLDLDVLAVGPAVREVAADFERYWQSPSSHPVARLLPPAATASRMDIDAAAAAYFAEICGSDFVHELAHGGLAVEWAPVRVVSDDPRKGLGLAAPGALVAPKLQALLGYPKSTLDIVSSYFVPAAEGTRFLAGLARQGVRVRVLTNSLEATDVPPVHAGYARRRKALLEAGVELYELRRLAAGARPRRRRRLVGSRGSSASSLHAKAFAVDGTLIFVGSFNFDPRSAELNTEMGFVIESRAVARGVGEMFDTRVRTDAYELRLSGTGRLSWVERRGGEEIVHATEPGTTAWQRAAIAILSRLPGERLL